MGYGEREGCMEDLKLERIIIEGDLDPSDEVRAFMVDGRCLIDEEMAQEIVNHLCDLFNVGTH